VKFKKGLPGRIRKLDSAVRRRHLLERREREKAFEVNSEVATPEEVAALVTEVAYLQGTETVKTVCPLCNQQITVDDAVGGNVVSLIVNNKPVQVHRNCPKE
jgi:uncharacterized protein with PIN domain